MIIVCLKMFHSLNLKRISELTGISESTALRKVRGLLEEKHIILDNDATLEHRGKYYRLSQQICNILDQTDTPSYKFKEEVQNDPDRIKLPKMLAGIEALTNLNASLFRIFSQYFKLKYQKQNQKLTVFPLISMSMVNLQLDTEDDRKEYSQYFHEFLQKIEKFVLPAKSGKLENHNFFCSVFPIDDSGFKFEPISENKLQKSAN